MISQQPEDSVRLGFALLASPWRGPGRVAMAFQALVNAPLGWAWEHACGYGPVRVVLAALPAAAAIGQAVRFFTSGPMQPLVQPAAAAAAAPLPAVPVQVAAPAAAIPFMAGMGMPGAGGADPWRP